MEAGRCPRGPLGWAIKKRRWNPRGVQGAEGLRIAVEKMHVPPRSARGVEGLEGWKVEFQILPPSLPSGALTPTCHLSCGPGITCMMDLGPFFEHFLFARHSAKHLQVLAHLLPSQQPIGRYYYYSFPFYRWRNWGPKRIRAQLWSSCTAGVPARWCSASTSRGSVGAHVADSE